MTASVRDNNRFDAIVIGSGPGGATVAKELAREKRKILILERGDNRALGDSLFRLATLAKMTEVGEGLVTTEGSTTGGTTSLYFAAVVYPSLKKFLSYGIDLRAAQDWAELNLPVGQLREDAIAEQVHRIKESAHQLGYPWARTEAMLIDNAKCQNGYRYEAKWTARAFVNDAVDSGAILENKASVTKILIEGDRAIGVEYVKHHGFRRTTYHKVYADKIILAAGAISTPTILRNSGLKDVAKDGFFCDPGFLVLGHVPGLKGSDLFSGSMGTNYEDNGLLLGDGCLSKSYHFGLMLDSGKFSKLFSQNRCVGVGVMVRDKIAGEVSDDGRFFKKFSQNEEEILERGKKLAWEIVENAGARGVFATGVSASHIGGTMSIGRYVDSSLETEIRNLYVCDASVLPEDIRLPPAFTLACLGRYLSNSLCAE